MAFVKVKFLIMFDEVFGKYLMRSNYLNRLFLKNKFLRFVFIFYAFFWQTAILANIFVADEAEQECRDSQSTDTFVSEATELTTSHFFIPSQGSSNKLSETWSSYKFIDNFFALSEFIFNHNQQPIFYKESEDIFYSVFFHTITIPRSPPSKLA